MKSRRCCACLLELLDHGSTGRERKCALLWNRMDATSAENKAKTNHTSDLGAVEAIPKRSDHDVADRLVLPATRNDDEAYSSYHRVYRKFRYALSQPTARFFARLKRFSASYGLPIGWGFVGAVSGLCFIVAHHHLKPSINLPARSEMKPVFALHDLNEIIIESSPKESSKQ